MNEPLAEHPVAAQLFLKLKTWMRDHAPDVKFRAPVNPAVLDHFLEVSGLQLPPLLKQILSISDGETRSSAGAIGNWRMLPVNEIQASWGLLTKLTEKGAFSEEKPKASPYIRPVWWHPGWIPFVSSDQGHYLCVDIDPIELSRRGQVILFMQMHPERLLVGENLAAWLARINEDLDEKLYHYDPESGFDGEGFMWSALEGKHIFDNYPGDLIV